MKDNIHQFITERAHILLKRNAIQCEIENFTEI